MNGWVHIELAAPVAHVWYTRRVPSHMGLLLNVSRRNLDRVLYFAQYVITSVDDDARERALKRLEEELAAAEIRLQEEVDSSIGNATSGATGRVQELEAALVAHNESFDDRLANATDEVVREAKATEQRLDNLKDSKATEDIVLWDSLIVAEGDKVGREHSVMVQDITTERLTQIQTETEEDHQKQVATMQKELEELRDEASAVSDDMQDDFRC